MRYYNDWFDTLFDGLVPVFETAQGKRDSTVYADDKGNFNLEMELPGIKKDEVKITHENNYLVIQAKSKRKNAEKRTYLPADKWDIDKAEVNYENGLLEVKVPPKQAPPKLGFKTLQIKGP